MEFENSNVMFYLRGKYITNLFESFSNCYCCTDGLKKLSLYGKIVKK